MIHINQLSEAPPSLQEDKIQKAKRILTSFYKLPLQKRRQQKFSFDWQPIESAHDTIAEHFNHKCVYCESIDHHGVIDNFRPKNGSIGIDNKFSPDHYYWLVYDIRNLYYSCETCSRNKGSFFPIYNSSRCKIGTPYEKVIQKEITVIIDPGIEEPVEYLTYENNGLLKASDGDTGSYTIELLKLNRTELALKRKKNLKEFISNILNPLKTNLQAGKASEKVIVKEFIVELLQHHSKIEYAFFLRCFFADWLTKLRSEHLEAIEKYYGKNLIKDFIGRYALHGLGKESKVHKKFENFTIEQVDIVNFKGIGKLHIDFPKSTQEISKNVSHQPWLMMLGENGRGKSSCLQAICLAIMGRKYLRSLKISSKSILKHGTDHGYVSVRGSNFDNMRVTFSKGQKVETSVESPASFLLAYGSTRLYPFGNLRSEKALGKVRALNLFRPDYALTDACEWIVSLHNKAKRSAKNKELFDWVGRAIKDLLLLKKNAKLEVRRGKALIVYGKKSMDELEELSDGYKSIVALTVDIIKTLLQNNMSIESATGIILIDEIGTHLHPRWRMQVVKRLRTTFPKLQFIVTTHDPLCLKGLLKGEVIVFDKKGQQIFTKTDLPDPAAMNAEQLLGSEFFGLKSTRDPEVEEKFNEYYYLLSRKKLSATRQERLKVLETFVRQKQYVGSSEYERLMNHVVHEQLANKKFNVPDTSVQLKQETMDKINAIMSKAN